MKEVEGSRLDAIGFPAELVGQDARGDNVWEVPRWVVDLIDAAPFPNRALYVFAHVDAACRADPNAAWSAWSLGGSMALRAYLEGIDG